MIPINEANAAVEVFVLRAAIEALIAGDAQLSDDGRKISWPEPDCDPSKDRLIGIKRTDDNFGWMPLIEMASDG